MRFSFNYFFRNFKQFVLLFLLLTLSLFFISVSDSEKLMSFRSFSFGLFAAGTEFLQVFSTAQSVKKENMRLKEKNAELMIEINKFREAVLENSEIKKMLSIRDTSSYSLIFSQIVYRAFSSTQGNLVIKAGSSSGIEKGMPVIAYGGFVGIIYSVDKDFSVVRTLRDVNFKVVVKEQGSRYNGILKWNGSSLQVTNLPKTSELNIGDRIVTSEISSLIPIPLNVGNVSRIINPEKGVMSDIEIKPSVDIDAIEYVFVIQIKSEIPDEHKPLNVLR